MNRISLISKMTAWLMTTVVLAIGLINTFWGNDPGYGIFILLLSLVYLPPANRVLKRLTRYTIPAAVKIVLALFIFWSALGVAELFDKISLMLMDLEGI